MTSSKGQPTACSVETEDRYAARGVSSMKNDVHAAIACTDSGLYPGAFCKIVADSLTNDPEWCLAMHADGAGTKVAVAYLHFRETGDSSCFEGIAQDALVMNTDDVICVGGGLEKGATMLYSSSIGRNARLIPREVLSALIRGNEKFSSRMAEHGLQLVASGGETADVGDLVRTVMVDSTVTARLRRDMVIDGSKIQGGDVIVGLSSTGRTTYEDVENSGVGSNGLTMARHELLSAYYDETFPETRDEHTDTRLRYCGPHRLSDPLPSAASSPDSIPPTIGSLLLSPTRTYWPVLAALYERGKDSWWREIHAVIHCSGGGQAKCLRFSKGLLYVKDQLFPCPPLMSEIQRCAQLDWRQMYKTFNMGHRMELYGPPAVAGEIIAICKEFNLEAKVIGRVEDLRATGKGLLDDSGEAPNRLSLVTSHGSFEYVQGED